MNRRLEVKLSSWQRQRLQQIRDHPPSARVGKRAVCLLLSSDGSPSKLISQVTGLSKDAIPDIRRRWQERGMASLKELPRPGRPPKDNTRIPQTVKKGRAGRATFPRLCLERLEHRKTEHLFSIFFDYPLL